MWPATLRLLVTHKVATTHPRLVPGRPMIVRRMPAVSDRTATIGTMPVFWREAPVAGAPTPLYLHGVPTNSDDWLPPAAPWRGGVVEVASGAPTSRCSRPLRDRVPGAAPAGSRPTCPGSGAPARPATSTTRSTGYADFIERYLDLVSRPSRQPARARLGLGRARVRPAPSRAHRAAGRHQRHPVAARLPLAPHRAPLSHPPCWGSWRWARPHAGSMRRGTREARAPALPLPEGWLDSGLRPLRPGHPARDPAPYRGAPPDVLAAAGARLRRAERCPRWSVG